MTPLDDRDPVDVLAEDFADRLRRGEHPSVSDYAAKHPSHAAQLRDLLPAVAQMEQLKRFKKSAAADAKELPDRLGDFRIVRELGRGGMGVVFEAVQESLGRRVALKILASHAQLTPERRERFIREAKAVAKLHHTNIVPVFGVGEQDGLPYYVMQLIPGRSLHAIASGWRAAAGADTSGPIPGPADTTLGPKKDPAPRTDTTRKTRIKPAAGPRCGDWEFVAEVGAQAADALQYAHEQGVLHRDVKPANLLLDGRRQVWVADFGVAKIVDGGTLTATGDILGTLQYMAPECLHGTADPRSDVYGLGATLYELLTLRPPFDSLTPAGLVKQIADTDPPHPRAINPDIPRDLETIVLKALAREPSRRYASAELLADDLRAFLDDRPIRARRVTAFDRVARWCRKNPATAVLSFSTLAALVLAAVVGWVGYARTTTALANEAARRDEAEDASRKLEANLKLSLEAFEAVFVAAGGNDFRPPPIPGFGRPQPGPQGNPFGPQPKGPPTGELEHKAAVLEAVLEFYEKFAQQNATNPRLQFEAAKAHRRVGELNQWLNRGDPVASFRKSADVLEDLIARFPDKADAKFELVMVYAAAPFELFQSSAAAERQLTAAVERVRDLDDLPNHWAAGEVYLKLGWVREQAGKPAEATAAYRDAIAELTPRPDRSPLPPNVVVERAIARQRLAGLLAAAEKLNEAEQVLNEGVKELEPNEPRPGGRPDGNFNPAGRTMLVSTLRQLGDVRERLGDRRGADAARFRANQVMTFTPPKDGPRPKDKDGPPPKK